MGRGVRAQSNAERPIRASLLPIAFPWKRDHVETQARQGVPAREKDRMRGKPRAVRVGAGFPWPGGNIWVFELLNVSLVLNVKYVDLPRGGRRGHV